ncbi:MAG: PTS system mannose/fructose/sorbose family transporter subunit IID [Bacillota bacterium]|nr:PTS system mannose/fructose/sorbose family transporter subunit IID [Bacillota bacterium]
MSEPVENRPVDGGGEGPMELDQATVRSAMWRHILTLQWSWNYERMQALGYCYSMLPVIDKVYKTKEERIAAMKRHLAFYNTNPQVGSPPIFGATVALEAQKQGQMVDSLKVALMGPLAGIGDTLQAVLYRPIIAVFAASMALSGSLGGPLLMFLSGLLWTALMIPLFRLGYREGVGLAAQVAEGGLVTRITDLATLMGVIVIGGFVPSIMAKVQTPLEFARRVTVQGKVTEQVVKIQSVLDQIVPYLIPVLLVAFAYWLLRGLRLSPVWVMVVLFVVGFGLSALGVL